MLPVIVDGDRMTQKEIDKLIRLGRSYGMGATRLMEHTYRMAEAELKNSIVIDSIDNHFKQCMQYYINDYMKGKTMTKVFEVLAIQAHEKYYDGLPTIIVPITTVVAENEVTAKQDFTIDNAKTLKGKLGVTVLARPFC